MSGAWRSATRRPHGKWSVWKYGWIVHHRVIDALERVRGHARGLLLDVGCGAKPFAGVFRGVTYVGCDLVASPFPEDPRPEVLARAEMLPFRDGSIDTVFCISTLNYLPEPVRMLEEAHRVLRRDGAVIVEFLQMAPPDQPDDYLRFTRAGALELLRRAGLEPLECVPIGGLWARVGLSAIHRLKSWNRGPTRVLTELPVRALYAALQLVFDALDRVRLDPDEVLAHVIVARPMEATSPLTARAVPPATAAAPDRGTGGATTRS